MNIVKKITAVFVMFIYFTQYPISAYAYESIRFDKTASLRVLLETENVRVKLYRVGDIGADGQLYLSNSYAKYAVLLDGEAGESSSEAACVLETYFQRDQVTALQEKTTDSYGEVLFEDLELGVYLVSSEYIMGDNDVLMFSPMLLSLPMKLDGVWQYDLNSNVKNVRRSLQSRCVAYKIWKDNERNRPKAVTVQLLRDGVVIDELILNKDNSWRYVWDGLDEHVVWSVIEKEVPKGYTLGMSRDGMVYVLENTSEETEEPESEVPKKEDVIPQTGQDWRPVYVFATAGVICIILGIRITRLEKKMKDK